MVRLARLLRRSGSRNWLRLGQFARTKPLSPDFGWDRGQPIDRYYIERFLAANASDIRGRVLEIGDDSYSRQFGGAAVERQEILHVNGQNPKATVVGDLSQPDVLPEGGLDCIILTQTLHLIYDMKAAVEQIRRSLRPGGVALVTVPGITPIDRNEWRGSWYWSLTADSARRLFAEAFGEDAVSVTAFGNVFAATAFLHGAAVEEIDRTKLDLYDEAFPVIVAVRVKAGHG